MTQPASGAEAMAAFLRAELDSPTEADRLRAVLQRLGVEERVVRMPRVGRPREDQTRWRIFDHYRGRETLFEGLDLRTLEWVRVELAENDVRQRAVTCRHHFEATYESRDPGRIATLLSERGVPNGVLDRLQNGELLDPPLLVSTPELERLVILEGHNRMLSYLRAVPTVGFPMAAFIGVGEAVSSWHEWP